jgi:4-cresol dehydrogenase (hydroxylating)
MNLISVLIEKLDSTLVDIISGVPASQHYGKTTFSDPIELDGAIIVKKIDVIAKVLTLANDLGFHLFPVSSGNNWGYGSVQNIKTTKPCIVLDLLQLNQITATNKDLGLITIQPGVTQQMLYEYLNKEGWHYMTPVTGAGPNCSILSNALERGYGITPRTDHFLAVNALKAYLPHPQLCNTQYQSATSDMDGTGNDFIDKTYKWGLGPYLDGIFSQSNLAIVTEITIRLAPTPKYFCAFYLQIHDSNQFENTIELIRDFLQEFEGIVGSINLMDRSRLVSMTAKNPNTPEKHVVMTEKQISDITSQKRLPEWMVVGSLYGSKPIVKFAKKQFKLKASKLGKIYFSDSLLMRCAKSLTRLPLPNNSLINGIKQQLESLNEGMEIMQGKPNQIALPLAYWRNPRITPNKNKNLLPDKDQCGLLWYAPLLPMEPSKLKDFVSFIRNTTPKFGIEPLITFTNLRHDCIDATVPIVFDLHNIKARKLAHQCLNELIVEGKKLGFVPYRLDTTQQMKLNPQAIFWKTTSLIKQTLDPNNVISPGRYNP